MKNCKLTVMALFSGVVILWIVIFRLGYISISKPHTSSKHTKQSKQQSKQTTTEKGGGASGSEIDKYLYTLERVMSELEKSVSSCYRLNDYHDKYHKMYNNLKEKSQPPEGVGELDPVEPVNIEGVDFTPTDDVTRNTEQLRQSLPSARQYLKQASDGARAASSR